MKSKFFIFLSFLIVISCKKDSYKQEESQFFVTERVAFTQKQDFLELKSGKFIYKIPNRQLPMKKVVLLNSSLLGYFEALHLEDKIIGISSPEYIYSQKIRNLVDKNKIANVGDEQKYNIEKIIALKPNVVFTNYISSFENSYDILKKNGIMVVFLDEYLEKTPIDKTRYLLVFGKLFGVDEFSTKVLSEIEENYEKFKIEASKSSEKPLVLVNEMYGNQWFMSGGKTPLAQYLKDANAQYILAENQDANAVPMSFEEVLVKSENAPIWVNAGSHQSRKNILATNPNYQKINAFRNGEVYTIGGRMDGSANDFFESGAVRSDLILKDYIKIFHPNLFPNDTLIYLRQLN